MAHFLGQTSLQGACRKGNLEMVNALIAAAANVNIADRIGIPH